MRSLLLALGAVSLGIPAATVMLPAPAQASATAKSFDHGAEQNRRYKKKNHSYREWKGRDGRRYCRKSDGTTGLVIGAVGGALVGRTIDSGGDRTAGTLLGAVGGGLLGREIDRGGSRKRCR